MRADAAAEPRNGRVNKASSALEMINAAVVGSQRRRLRPAGKPSGSSSWPFDGEAKILGGVRHPPVIGDDSPQVRADDLGRCKMDRVETS